MSETSPPNGRPHSRKLFGVVVRPLQAFLQLEAASGILLLLAAVLALAWANLAGDSYRAVFVEPYSIAVGGVAASLSLRALINDGLMTIFFFVVGMEVKRELVVGELNSGAKAALPAIAALGGMLVPAAVFVALNVGGPGQNGWGVPMATDIAFCVGVMTLLGNRVPRSLVVFLTALAIFDDIGGILVIALFYGDGLHLHWLLGSVALATVLVAMNRQHVGSGLAYGAVGALLWYTLHHGGVHAPIAGVILGLAIPARPRRPPRQVLDELGGYVASLRHKPTDEELDAAEIAMIEEKLEELQAPLARFIELLHPLVAFGVMPLFAVANTGMPLGDVHLASLASPVALGAGLGLLLGKPIGIFLFTFAAVRLRWAPLPRESSLGLLFGVSVVAGIGFTIALYIAALAFAADGTRLNEAKLGILVGSLAAGGIGFGWLRRYSH